MWNQITGIYNTIFLTDYHVRAQLMYLTSLAESRTAQLLVLPLRKTLHPCIQFVPTLKGNNVPLAYTPTQEVT